MIGVKSPGSFFTNTGDLRVDDGFEGDFADRDAALIGELERNEGALSGEVLDCELMILRAGVTGGEGRMIGLTSTGSGGITFGVPTDATKNVSAPSCSQVRDL